MCTNGNGPRCSANPEYYYGLLHDGGYQQYLAMHDSSLVKLPESISFSEGSFLNCTAAVALRGLQFHGKVKPGSKVLITGASGGVGVHAIQVAKALGATVVCVTSNESKVSALRELGADYVVVSQQNEFHKQGLN
jgi:acryloyl-coenzyme A reductase